MDASPRPALVIQPSGVTSVVDQGFNLARQNYRALIRVSAVGLVPAFLVVALIALATSNNQTAPRSPRLLAGIGVLAVVLGIVAGIAWVLSSIATAMACSRLIVPTERSNDLATGSLYRAAWGRFGSVILLGIVGIFCALTLIIPPLGIYLVVRWAMSFFALVLEGDGPIRALRHSWGLTRRSWWHVVGVSFVSGLAIGTVSYMVVGLCGAVGAVLSLSGSSALGSLSTNLGSLLGTLITAPFSWAIYVVLYYELRARNEGLDLLARIDQTLPPAS